MHGNQINAEPGTGTQIYTEATCDPLAHAKASPEHDVDEMSENDLHALTVYRIDGNQWECGRDYFDTEIQELFELKEVVRKSGWCSTKSAENGRLKLVFEGDRFGELVVDPQRQDDDVAERFIPRYRAPRPPGV
jgi:hypothetical protein